MSQDLYKEELLDLYRYPLHQGEITDADKSLEEHNASCGDKIKIFVKLKDGVIVDLKWEGSGCVISQVQMSLLVDYILSHKLTLAQAKKITRKKLLELMGLTQISPGREKCLLMGLKALQKI